MTTRHIGGILLLVLVLFLAFSGCEKEKIVESTEYIHDIEYLELLRRNKAGKALAKRILSKMLKQFDGRKLTLMEDVDRADPSLNMGLKRGYPWEAIRKEMAAGILGK